MGTRPARLLSAGGPRSPRPWDTQLSRAGPELPAQRLRLMALLQAFLSAPGTSTGHGGRVREPARLLLQGGKGARDEPLMDQQGAGHRGGQNTTDASRALAVYQGQGKPRPVCCAWHNRVPQTWGPGPGGEGISAQDTWARWGPGRATGRAGDPLRAGVPRERSETWQPGLRRLLREPHGQTERHTRADGVFTGGGRTPARNKRSLPEAVLPRGHQATQPGA